MPKKSKNDDSPKGYPDAPPLKGGGIAKPRLTERTGITKIIIENFKGIRDRVEIPIRPITLLFGANSAGKTTVLHALLYLRELLDRKNADADRVVGGGETINLGGFDQLVHGHNRESNITVGVEFTLDDDGLEPYPMGGPNLSGSDNYEDPPNWTKGLTGVKTVQVEVTTGYSESVVGPTIKFYCVLINGQKIGSISGDIELRAVLDEFIDDHPIFNQQFDSESFDEDEWNPITDMLYPQLEGLQHEHESPSYITSLGHSVIPDWGKTISLFESEPEPLLYDPEHSWCESIMSQLLVRPGELILDHLKSLRHLGPIRTTPDLSSNAQRSPNMDRWVDGMAAWDLLHKEAESRSSSGPSLIQEVDLYLRSEDYLNLGYSISSQQSFDLPTDSLLIQLLEQLMLEPEEYEDASMLRKAYEDVTNGLPKTRLVLTDIRRNTIVSPTDIGAGVSQIIPILVAALERSSKATSIEQPELHLHPAVQCSLGDLFVRSLNSQDERRFLIETHSEHLLLRLMRRLRDTHNGDTESLQLRLTPRDITILFVETHDGRSIYREMPLNERGELVKAWPGGFFEEDIDELI